MGRAVKVLSLLICIFIFLPSPSTGDSVEYFYDDSGRLVRVVKGNEVLIYNYDEVGNLLSITKGTINTNASPVINSIVPDVLFIGQTTPVVITGQNFFTTKNVTSNNPYLSIRNLSITDTTIKADITASSGASPGSATITVTTSYGSASIAVTLSSSKLSFSPGQLALTSGGSGGITATIYPSIGRDITIVINNTDTSVVSVPNSATIPSSGTASFTVTGLKEGIATISSGEPKTVVFVTKPFTLEPNEEITNKAGPVSVYIEESGNSSIQSLPISIYIDAPSIGESSIQSLPVSVYIEVPASTDSATVSLPVSVYVNSPAGDSSVVSLPVSTIIAKESITDASIQSLPVSAYIEPVVSNNSTIASLPVSAYIEPAVSNNSTIASLPVSAYIEPAVSNNNTIASLPVSAYVEPAIGNSTVMALPVSVKISPQ